MLKMRLWLGVLAIGGCTAIAHAQDAHMELAQMLSAQQAKTMQVMFNSGTMENMQRSVQMMVFGGDSEKSKAAEERTRPRLEKFKKSIESAMLSSETQSLIRNAIESSLRKVYTLEEAQAQINFFRSPQGASIYEKTGALNAELAQVTPQLMQRLVAGPMRELLEDMKSLSKEK